MLQKRISCETECSDADGLSSASTSLKQRRQVARLSPRHLPTRISKKGANFRTPFSSFETRWLICILESARDKTYFITAWIPRLCESLKGGISVPRLRRHDLTEGLRDSVTLDLAILPQAPSNEILCYEVRYFLKDINGNLIKHLRLVHESCIVATNLLHFVFSAANFRTMIK